MAGAWRGRDFRSLWFAQTVSQFGTQITFIAVPLIAIRSFHASPFAIGALNALDFAPFVLFGFLAGVLADRVRRRTILVVADLLRALFLVSVPAAYFLHVLILAQLFAVTVLVAAASVAFDVAYQSYLPSLVERRSLVDANSKLELSRSAAQVTGAGAAGVLIQTLTGPGAILVDAASFLASAAAVRRIRRAESRLLSDPPKLLSARSVLAEIREGGGFVRRQRALRQLALSSAVANLGIAIVEALILIYAARSLHLGAAVIGAIFAAGNAGIAIGAGAASRVVRRVGTGWAAAAGTTAEGLGLLLVPLAHGEWAIPGLVVAQIVRTTGIVTFNIAQVSLRQHITPDSILGRVNATMRVISWTLIPVGALLGGGLGSLIGIRLTLFVGAGLGALAVIPSLTIVGDYQGSVADD